MRYLPLALLLLAACSPDAVAPSPADAGSDAAADVVQLADVPEDRAALDVPGLDVAADDGASTPVDVTVAETGAADAPAEASQPDAAPDVAVADSGSDAVAPADAASDAFSDVARISCVETDLRCRTSDDCLVCLRNPPDRHRYCCSRGGACYVLLSTPDCP